MSDNYDEQPTLEPAPEPAPVPNLVPKKKREGKKLSDKQKADLNKHMEKLKKGGMSASEMKSHRMKMMGRMRNKNMSVNKAHKDIKSSK